MSYPKKHPLQVSPDQRIHQKNQKKEQLKHILINKFRTKYGPKADAEDIYRLIKSQVEYLVYSEGQMTESNLKQLDKLISDKLKGVN